MKKILLFAAAMAALGSCSKVNVGVKPPKEEGKQVTVTASLGSFKNGNESDNNDNDGNLGGGGGGGGTIFSINSSRATIGDDWNISWDEADKMMAVEASGIKSTLKRAEGETDPADATFSGRVSGESEYRVIYPDMSTPTLSDNKLAVDLTAQSSSPLYLYMISNEVIEATNTTPEVTMEQVVAAIELNINIGTEYKDQQISSIKVGGLNSKGSIDLTKEVDDDNFYGATESSEITIDCQKSTVDESGIISSRFTILPTTGVEEISMEVTLADGTKAIGTTKVDRDFARATYSTITTSKINNWDCYAAAELAIDGEISSAEELAWLAKSVNSGESFAGVTFTLTKDIDLSAHEWVAIGTENSSFSGIIDGAGYTISGLKIDQAEANNQGLFGYTYSSKINNLTIEGEVTGNEDVGGLVGNNYGWITNCHSNVTVKGSANVGGIAGSNSTYRGIITNCHNSGEISGIGDNSSCVGGIIGSDSGIRIVNSYNSGKVSGDSYIGGIVGEATSAMITSCYNSGKASGTSYIGGIAGSNRCSILNCYWNNENNDESCGKSYNDLLNVVGMSAGEMKGSGLTKELNNAAERYNQCDDVPVAACAWAHTSGEYPTLDYNKEPALSDSLEQLGDDGSFGDTVE